MKLLIFALLTLGFMNQAFSAKCSLKTPEECTTMDPIRDNVRTRF